MVDTSMKKTENRAPSTGLPCNIIVEFLAPESHYLLDKTTEMDEFEEYFQCSTTSLRSGPTVLQLWIESETRFPELAFDVHSIPAMAAECGRVFSWVGQILTKQRKRLSDIVEANECFLA